jgi:transcriptional regulator with XRE-family HTH domain
MEEATFKRFLHVRLENGGSLASVGRDFGVTKQAVARWLRGERPSGMALMLARYLCRAPLEMTSGLPLASERDRST